MVSNISFWFRRPYPIKKDSLSQNLKHDSWTIFQLRAGPYIGHNTIKYHRKVKTSVNELLPLVLGQ